MERIQIGLQVGTMSSLIFLSLMYRIGARGCFFFILTILCFQYLIRSIGMFIDKPHQKQKFVLASKLFLGAVFDSILVLASLKQDAFTRKNFWDYCCALWVAFPFFAISGMVSSLLLIAKLITVCFFRYSQGPSVVFYSWLFLVCCLGTIMMFMIVAELTSNSKTNYTFTTRLSQLYTAAIIYLAFALVVHFLCKDTLR